MLRAINDRLYVNFPYFSIRQEKIKMQKRRKVERGNYQEAIVCRYTGRYRCGHFLANLTINYINIVTKPLPTLFLYR